MSRATDIITRCAKAGIQLNPTPEGKLHYKAPQEAITPELVSLLKAHKPEILAALRRQQSPATANAAARLARTPTGGAEVEQAVKAPELTLYVGRRDGLRAWSRWPLDEKYWQPELN